MYIHELEDYVEEEIFYRGENYIDSVFELEQVDVGEFSASVIGTNTYSVFVKVDVKDNDIEEYTCDCPYDWGDMCKHIVAVLLCIREDKLIEEGKIGTTSQKLKLTLKDVSEKELKDFVLDYTKRNREFREDLMRKFG